MGNERLEIGAGNEIRTRDPNLRILRITVRASTVFYQVFVLLEIVGKVWSIAVPDAIMRLAHWQRTFALSKLVTGRQHHSGIRQNVPSPDSSEQTDPQRPSSKPGSVTIEAGTLRVTDDWLLSHYRSLASVASSLSSRNKSELSIDLSGLDRIDTAGASQLASLIGPERLLDAVGANYLDRTVQEE